MSLNTVRLLRISPLTMEESLSIYRSDAQSVNVILNNHKIFFILIYIFRAENGIYNETTCIIGNTKFVRTFI